MVEFAAAVVIGRNEGDRLVRCLASLRHQDIAIVYVDSGSTDGSVAAARAVGAEVVELDLSKPFTAARARNAGYARLREVRPGVEFVQFVDGDCEMAPGWIAAGLAAMAAEPRLAGVFGWQRERFPEATIWNRLIDAEWTSVPVGEVGACGGNVLLRIEAFDAIGGYRDDLIAGEEPEMCYRLRRNGWRIRRIDAEMALHDADMTRISQWWRRNRRAGHTYAEGARLHGAGPERYNVAKLRKTLFWAVGIPVLALVGCLAFGTWGLFVLLAWPLQVLRLVAQGTPALEAFFLMLGKLPEAQGALSYLAGQAVGRQRRTLIEYK